MPVNNSQPVKVKRNGTGRKATGKRATKPEMAPVEDETVQGKILKGTCRLTCLASFIWHFISPCM